MMKIIAIILIIIGVILFFVKRNQSIIALNLKLARPTRIAELKNTAQAIVSEIGGGSWRDYVKIWGKVTTDEPLFSEIKQEACVYYRMSVTRKYRQRNEDGDWEEKTQTVASNQRSIPFFLKDETGTIEVNPEEAKIDTIKILDEFRQGEATGRMISWGNFSLVLNGNQDRTFGYRYRESILPVGREVLVVGEVSDETGNLKIRKPISSRQNFLISLKSNETLTESFRKNERNSFYGMIAFLFIGFCLLIISFI